MLAVLAGVKDLLQNCSGIGVDGFSKVERGGGVVEQDGENHGVPEVRLGPITFLCHNCCYVSAPDPPVGEELDSVGEGLLARQATRLHSFLFVA